MNQSAIVWDLETMPDLAGFAAANDLVGRSDAEVREAIGDKFPKHIYAEAMPTRPRHDGTTPPMIGNDRHCAGCLQQWPRGRGA